ncbi:ASKHA domain-containing protein [Thermodesulfobacterium hveragerdense]|uniref:ASKHA domain-containing protein n=1 Tax=Thermodesulfobacterium hveragerdense TaxID=53424 RepID=UPI00040DF548|nr:ASKHA domain-containing protein [Thermodesulfobacterium hveragerdense]
MPKVKFLPFNEEYEALEGDTLFDVAIKAGIHINASCGGSGSCNRCKVRLIAGELKGEILEGQYYKACGSYPLTDVVIEVPLTTFLDQKTLYRPVKKRAKFLELSQVDHLSPPVREIVLKLDPPTLDENTSDLTRLKDGLFKQGIAEPEVPLEILRKIPFVLRQKGFETIAYVYQNSGNSKSVLLDLTAEPVEPFLGVAIDVGTTTLQVEVVDLRKGKVLGFSSDYNPQIKYGDDVITRIEFCRRDGGLKILSEVLRERLLSLIKEALGLKRRLEDVKLISLAANTVMTHLFLELEPRYLREYPYVPVATEFPVLWAKDLGFKDLNALIQIVPCKASYVGGDIVGGVVASKMYEESPLTLFIDLGTNGEIVLGNQDFLVCAACSAGPAFEGGGIKHGMRATLGAIEMVNIDPYTYEPMVVTIGKVKPIGLCGSGILSLLASLFRVGIIDKSGKIKKDIIHPRIRKGEEGWEYVVVFKQDTQTGEDIVFTEPDIDNVIRAKAAIFAGCQVLVESVGLSLKDIERVYLAGSFGNYLDVEDAISIGLLPDLDRDRFFFLGNTSLAGAKMALLSQEKFAKMRDIANSMTHLELANYQGYMNTYVAALFLPHTDESLFSTIKNKKE